MTLPESSRTPDPTPGAPDPDPRPPETPLPVEAEGPAVGRLPRRQPQRAVVVLLGYVAAVGVATLVAAALFNGPLVALAAIGLAALFAVPAAVLLPVVVTDGRDVDATGVPVLLRRPPEPGGQAAGPAGTGSGT